MLDLSVRPKALARIAREVPAWLLRLLTALARYRRRRAGLRALRDLEPHLLRDVGLEPCEIRAAARTGRSMRHSGTATAASAAWIDPPTGRRQS